jgi:hypothetical protein
MKEGTKRFAEEREMPRNKVGKRERLRLINGSGHGSRYGSDWAPTANESAANQSANGSRFGGETGEGEMGELGEV